MAPETAPARGARGARPSAGRAPEPTTGADLSAPGVRLPGGRARLLADLRRLAGLAARAARRPVALSVALLDDRESRRLNRERLGHDYATDVLSFPLSDGPEGLLGALALGHQVARREAARRGHPTYDELLLYAVHGTLHLLGHDDHRPVARARMRRAERRWLRALGCGDVYGADPPRQARRPSR